MKKIIIVFTAILALTFISCKQEKKEESTPTQMQEVMAVHDEVMPKMSTINSLIKKLEVKIDTTETGIKYEKAMQDLQAANKTMMDWMVGFGEKFDSDEIMKGKALTDEKKKWLDEEEIKVNAMKEQINSSIKNAEILLGVE